MGLEYEETKEKAKDIMTYKPFNSFQKEASQKVAKSLEEALVVIMLYIPNYPDKSVAIRKLRKCRMDCNSAITHCGKY